MSMLRLRLSLLALVLGLLVVPAASAQQKIGYVDSEYILGKLPEYQTIQQNIDRLAQEWDQEIESGQGEVDELFAEYQARELLYTTEERREKREAIIRAEDDLERLRTRYFGPDGELFQEQDRQMRPLQERVLIAIEEVATRDGYDYIFDKSGDFLFLFAREQNDVSDLVLEELGIDLEDTQRTGRGG